MNPAAVALGKLAKGIPKTLTQEERARRSKWAHKLNRKARAAKRLAAIAKKMQKVVAA
jgi:hypothetical protein